MANVSERRAFALLFFLLTAPTSAGAQTKSAAEVLFEDGRRLMDSGDYPAACAKLAESQRIDPAGGTLMNLAACHERMGKTATAWAEFNDARAQARREGRRDREIESSRRIAEIEPHLARLTVTADAGSSPLLEVRLDDTVLGAASWGASIPIDPGEHDLRASAPGRIPWAKHLRIAPETSLPIVVPFLAASPPSSEATHFPIRGDHGDQSLSHRSTPVVPIVLGSAAVVALGVGTYFGFVAAAKKHDSDPYCTPSGCTSNGASLLRQANTAAWGSDIGVGVGLGALAAAAYFFFSSSPHAAKQALSITPSLGPQSLGLGAHGSW